MEKQTDRDRTYIKSIFESPFRTGKVLRNWFDSARKVVRFVIGVNKSLSKLVKLFESRRLEKALNYTRRTGVINLLQTGNRMEGGTKTEGGLDRQTTDGRMDGQTDGRTDGRTDRRTDKHTNSNRNMKLHMMKRNRD